MGFDTLSNKPIRSAIDVHGVLGTGLLINFYEKILKNGIKRFVL